MLNVVKTFFPHFFSFSTHILWHSFFNLRESFPPTGAVSLFSKLSEISEHLSELQNGVKSQNRGNEVVQLQILGKSLVLLYTYARLNLCTTTTHIAPWMKQNFFVWKFSFLEILLNKSLNKFLLLNLVKNLGKNIGSSRPFLNEIGIKNMWYGQELIYRTQFSLQKKFDPFFCIVQSPFCNLTSFLQFGQIFKSLYTSLILLVWDNVAGVPSPNLKQILASIQAYLLAY